MNEKIALIQKIFQEQFSTETGDELEENIPNKVLGIKHGGYYGGVYKGRKYMYSEHMINSLSEEKLESFIRNQLGI